MNLQHRNNFNLRTALVSLVLVSLTAMGVAGAAPIDVTAAVATISDALAPIALIGAGVLTVVIVLKTWKWVRRAA